MQKTTIKGVSCYGIAKPGMNYELTFDDEYLDGVACDIEAHSWTAVINHLNKAGFIEKGLVQVIAV